MPRTIEIPFQSYNCSIIETQDQIVSFTFHRSDVTLSRFDFYRDWSLCFKYSILLLDNMTLGSTSSTALYLDTLSHNTPLT